MIDLLLLIVLFGPAANRVNALLLHAARRLVVLLEIWNVYLTTIRWNRLRARAFRSRCQPHRKRESRHYV